MIDYIAMGKRIRAYRLKRKWHQYELAEAVNLSSTTISHIEVGKGRPQLETVVNIANALQVTVDMLLCDSIELAETVYRNDISEEIEDCSNTELRFLKELIPVILHFYRCEKKNN